VRVAIKKTLRVELTSIIVESTRSTVQLATQYADSTHKVYFFHTHSCRINKRVIKFKKKQQRKKQKAKHDPCTCRSKVYGYYDMFEVLF
jgi:hypothetical protein